MDPYRKLSIWSLKHYPKWLAFVRMALGVFLCVKGFLFVADTDALMVNITDFYGEVMFAQYISYAHIFGGLFIAVGLITRISCIVQLPILIGAVFFVNFQKGIFSYGSDFLLSLVVLILLIAFSFLGSGKLSLSHYIIKKNQKEEDNVPT